MKTTLQTNKGIWHSKFSLDELQHLRDGNMVEHLGILLTEVGDNFLSGTMPVDERTKQSLGMLHGGASLVLAETLGSFASNLVVDPNKFYCVGLEINANHVRPVSEGFVVGVATPIHLGKKTHIWNIEIRNILGKLTCISRLTMAVQQIGI
jgi:1,4-dihydroxy-2-naphthoyl-CoA hydrolase